MPRKPRIEVEGGLYHIMTRGNNRQLMFLDEDDYQELRVLLHDEKETHPFYLYAYCLMPNHVHLLIERRRDDIGSIMQRLLTRFAQHHNRRYRKVGHLVQGRYKAILCQSDAYLAELVRYIHLNPVRAGLVADPKDHCYSGHREYLGLDQFGLVDVEPVLRHFGARKDRARECYVAFVEAAKGLDHRAEFYRAEHGRLLGSEEFIDSMIHRIGEVTRREFGQRCAALTVETLIRATENATGMRREEFHGAEKGRSAVMAKEALILVGRQKHASRAVLLAASGLAPDAVRRRHKAAKIKMRQGGEFSSLVRRIHRRLKQDHRIE